MELSQDVAVQQKTVLDDGEINPLDLVLALLERKRMIVGVTLALALMTLIITFIMSPRYQGIARLLVPVQSAGTASAMLSQLSGAAAILGDVTGLGSSPVEMYVGLTQSRTVADTIIKQFGLAEFYKNDRVLGRWRSFTADDARLAFFDQLIIESDTASGIISVSVLDKSPQKSADMTNAFVKELQRLVNKLAVTSASNQRQFYEEQVRESFEKLTRAEDAVQRFQETTGAVQLPDQARASLEGIALLEAQRAAKEIQLRVMKTYATEQNPDLRKLEEELNVLIEQRKKLESQGISNQSNPVIPTAMLPDLGTEYLRRLRELKFQEALYEALLKQYTTARLEEAKDTSNLQIVDEAAVPENVYSPQKVLWTAIGGVLGFFFAIGWAAMMGLLNKSSLDPINREKIEQIVRSLKTI